MARSAAQRAAQLKAAKASAAKRRRRGAGNRTVAQRLDQNTKNRRARNNALATGKRPPKRSAKAKIHAAGLTGATYGGIGTLSLKGAAVGYAVGATVGAGAIGASRASNKIRKVKNVRAKQRVKVRAR